jgi:hypothetical protein
MNVQKINTGSRQPLLEYARIFAQLDANSVARSPRQQTGPVLGQQGYCDIPPFAQSPPESKHVFAHPGRFCTVGRQ